MRVDIPRVITRCFHMAYKQRGRPLIGVRLDPTVLLSLRETAELYGVTVAELARAMINVGVRVGRAEMPGWQSRVMEIRAELGAFDGQLALPMGAGKPTQEAKTRKERGRPPRKRGRA